MDFMRQCVLTRKNLTTVGWIDEISAKVGVNVTIKEEANGEIWRVSMVGTHRITKTEAYQKRSDVFESIKK